MAKLKLLIDKSHDSPETLLTNFNTLLSNIEELLLSTTKTIN